MNVCTIIAKNYVAHARVLARSLAEHQPESRLWTLVIDDFSRYIDPAQEPFEVLTTADIGCTPFTHMALRYSVLELSTAVKPWLLRHLMSVTGAPVTYLDPDIKIYGPIGRLDELAARHGIALIPHNSEPIPADGRKPSQIDIMIAGVYNLGYVSLAPTPEVDRLLDWWSDRLVRDCRVDPVWGYFVDQRWFDLAPGFLPDLAIVREPEYNVAYWNLHERRLEHDGGRYVADGRPLAFFHFSGFDPEHPLILSRHQNRIDVVEHPVLEQLLAKYAAEVMAEGHAVSRHWPYGYGALGDGTRRDEKLPDLYDEFAQEQDGDVASPFTLAGMRAFDGWLRQEAPGSPPGVNRVLARVYEERSDLRAAYPDLAGTDRSALLLWAQRYGRDEEPLLERVIPNGKAAPDRLAAPSVATEEHSAPLRPGAWGVNVVGDFRSELATGEIARRVVVALDEHGVPAAPILRPATAGVNEREYATAPPQDAPFPVNVICLAADVLPEFVNEVGQEFFAGRHSIGVWLWDVNRFPERLRASFSLVEEVWAPTTHVAAALEPLATVPVRTIPIPVRPSRGDLRASAAHGPHDAKFTFGTSLDGDAELGRQNPFGAIAAFRGAFAPGDGARLVLECTNAERDPASRAAIGEAAAGHPDIEVFAAGGVSATALCDCYVSLHRAEAFGIAMADAMWLGKPVIATGYSGNLDYMTAKNSYLVDHRLVEVGPGHDPYPPEAVWAEPDIDHAAALMRRVFDDQDAARRLGAAAAQDIRRTHSPEVVGEIIGRRLESIRAAGGARRAADPARSRPPALAKLPMRVRQGPLRAGRAGPARELLRKAVLRALGPYTSYQRALNAELVAGLEELNDAIADVRNEAAVERARHLAEIRRNERSLGSTELGSPPR